LRTSELTHAAFDGADATLLAVLPQLTVEALGVKTVEAAPEASSQQHARTNARGFGHGEAPAQAQQFHTRLRKWLPGEHSSGDQLASFAIFGI
jgi:hypothetical protein